MSVVDAGIENYASDHLSNRLERINRLIDSVETTEVTEAIPANLT